MSDTGMPKKLNDMTPAEKVRYLVAERAADSKTIRELAAALHFYASEVNYRRTQTELGSVHPMKVVKWRKAEQVLSDNATQIAKAQEGKLTDILDAPAQDNPGLKKLMATKAPWEEEVG